MSGGHIPQYTAGIISLTVVDAVNTRIPRLTGQVTDRLVAGTADAAMALRVALTVLLLGAVIALGRFGWRYFLLGASRSIEKEMRNDLFAHLETLSARYFNTHKTGDLMAHFTNDLQSVRQLLGMTVISTFDASVMLALVLYSMLRYVSVRLTLIAVLPMILIIFGDIIFGKVMHRRFLLKQEAFGELTDQTREAVTGIRVVKAIGQVQQDVFLFTGDIASNIRLRNDEISDEAVRAAAEHVNAARFIERLPNGYHEKVSEGGATFSSGQRQLISFARTLAADPSILVLDEATSNIDTETELWIREALERLMRGRTTIMVAHRLSTVQNADRIIVIHHGQIRESGTHQELLEKNGIYKKLYLLQASAE